MISFDFLDCEDGALLEIQHSGSIETKLESAGVILGAPDGLKINTTNVNKSFIMRLLSPIISFINRIILEKNRSQLYTFLLVTLVLVSLTLVASIYNLIYGFSLNTSVTKFREIVVQEFPNATERDISTIIEKLHLNGRISNLITSTFIGVYFILIISALIFFIQRDFAKPYPKSLNLIDDLTKPSKDREAN